MLRLVIKQRTTPSYLYSLRSLQRLRWIDLLVRDKLMDPPHLVNLQGDDQLYRADQNGSVRPTEYGRSSGPVSPRLQLLHPSLLPHVGGGGPFGGGRRLLFGPSLTSPLVERSNGRILAPWDIPSPNVSKSRRPFSWSSGVSSWGYPPPPFCGCVVEGNVVSFAPQRKCAGVNTSSTSCVMSLEFRAASMLTRVVVNSSSVACDRPNTFLRHLFVVPIILSHQAALRAIVEGTSHFLHTYLRFILFLVHSLFVIKQDDKLST